MKKFISGMLLGILISSCIIVGAAEVKYTAVKSAFSILLNGKSIKSDKPVLTVNGEYYISAKQISDSLGLKYKINSKSSRIEIGEGTEASKSIDYKELYRNLEKHIGETVSFTGKVYQVQEEDDYTNLWIYVTHDKLLDALWTDLVVLQYDNKDFKTRLLNNDIIEFTGIVKQMFKYKTPNGDNANVPILKMKSIKLKP